ncbi:MAG: hypothetical protein ABIO45_13425 [Burkholderiaceae bacterium]
MAEKNLSGSAWKAFAKGKGYKDAPLLKAFEVLEKAEKGPPAAQLAALDEVDKQAELLRNLHKADKDLLAWLAGVAKSLALARNAVPAEAPAPKAAAAPALDAKSRALLSTAMLPLLAQVKKGGAMPVAIALASKDAAVLISRHDMGPTGRKLLAAYLGTGPGVKFIAGECVFEENAHTFVVKAGAGGLAKRLQAALLKQTGLRLRALRVRGDDPNDVDRDSDDDGATPEVGKPAGATSVAAAAPSSSPTAAKGAAQPTAKAPEKTVEKASTQSPAQPSAQAKAAYDTRLAKLLARLAQAGRNPVADSPKVKALLAFAQGKARELNHAAALLGLGEVEKALDAAPPASTSTPAATPSKPTAEPLEDAPRKLVDGSAPPATAQPEPPRSKPDAKPDDKAQTAAKPAFDEAAFRREWAGVKGGWRDALETVDAQVAQLQTALRKLGDSELTVIADKGLNGITGNFKTPVIVAVMEVDNARAEGLKKAAQKGVRAAKAFAAYLASEETVRVTDENPFGVKMTIRASLGKALTDMQTLLAPLA